MNVNAAKHQAKLLEWKGRVADCRSSGMSVKHWCEENDCSPRTYYRWEQEILGKVRQITKAESQPVLAELPVIKALPLQECSKRRDPFVPVLVIRFGQVELELSNAVSSELLSQVKELLRKGGPSKQRIKKTIAYQALERIGTMYALEDEWKSLTPTERLSRRQEHMKPLVEAYFAWVKGIDLDTVLSEKTKDGLRYSINQEKYLKAFLEDGEVPIDNSASERSIRPFCVGRSNWHVIDSIKGAQASAIVYSIVETAKANNLKPYEYLQHLLSVMMEHIYDADTAYLDDLMPWSENLRNRQS